MDVASDNHEAIASLVELAVSTDEPATLIAATGAELNRPLGLVDLSGTMLGRAPADGEGERAVSIARAAARAAVNAPSGWTLMPLATQRVRLGVLAVGPRAEPSHDESRILRLLPALLTDQLRRQALMRLQRVAFVRRLVSSPALTAHRARREAAELGVDLADAYWIAILAWHAGAIRPGVVEALQAEAVSRAEHAFTAQLDDHLVLLHPAWPGRDARAAEWFEDVATLACALCPAASVRAIAAQRPADLDALSPQAGHLAHLALLGARPDNGRLLSWSQEYALDDLLADQVAPEAARQFVEAQIGPLIAWDGEHGTSLLAVVEAGLDFPRQDRAAQRCFMHRNTFRHRLAQATELLGNRLAWPEGRLAVHVAIKIHRVLGSPAGAPAPRRARARPRRPRSGLTSDS